MLHRKLVGAVLTAILAGTLLAGCTSFKRYRIESVPQEFTTRTSPGMIKQFMQLYKNGNGHYFEKIRIVNDKTITAEYKQPLGETLLAVCTVDISDAGDGTKNLDVSLESKNGAYMTLDSDLSSIKRELNYFVVGGNMR